MGQTTRIGTHKTTVQTIDGLTTVTYHRTAVVRFNDKVIHLDTGDWRTVTTKLRMNQTATQFGLGFGVYQRNYRWYIGWSVEGVFQNQDIPYNGRTITLDRQTRLPLIENLEGVL